MEAIMDIEFQSTFKDFDKIFEIIMELEKRKDHDMAFKIMCAFSDLLKEDKLYADEFITRFNGLAYALGYKDLRV